MEQKEKLVVNRMYQDATVGMLAIDKILKKVKDETLKKILKKQFTTYEKFANKCDVLAMENEFDIKENSFFKKLKQTAMLYFSLWSDSSNRHIVELMITGNVMGVIDSIKIQHDLKTKNEELTAMVVEFREMQEDFYEKLKKQLARV